ncbi:MAG TPA: hypothetical protein V6D29_20215, partial [Leptolyngbyaceae cyanobacterium]
MEYWEFLLQKEGDQTWLPLESSEVEILEGRYRIMAHTSQLERPVQVRITQLILDPLPPKRRVMKRLGQTSDSGLMVVMPFTWLGAGTWEIHCSEPALEADSAAAQWQYAVKLQVLSLETSEGDEWFPEDWPTERHEESAEAPPDSPASTDSSAPTESFQSYPVASVEAAPAERLEPLSEDALMGAFEVIDQALAAAVSRGEENLAQGLGLSTTHRIELAQSALMVNHEQVLMVVGQVVAAGEETCPAGAIALRLIDPQSAEVRVTLQQALGQQTLPATFAIPVSLPADINTRLLLGEIILAVPAAETAQVLAVQRFTVTVDLASLLDAIANQGETDAELNVAFPMDGIGDQDETPKNVAGADLEMPPLVNARLPGPPARSMPILLLPKSGLTLPPKIYYPTPHEVAAHTPQLPPISRSTGLTADPDGVSESTDPAPAAPPTPTSPLSKQPNLPNFVKPKRRPAEEIPSPAPVAPPSPSTPAVSEFRTLNLQERFWSRLNSMAVEAYEAAAQRQAELEAAALESPPVEEEELREAPPEPFAGEVVIYEDPEEPQPVASAPIVASSATPPVDEEILIPPTPMLEMPEGELAAGDRVAVTLRVPFHPNRLYLKIWITDPQTRTLA